MVKGIRLHIGLNRVDSTRYQDEDGQPWSGRLLGCENDARDMKAIGKAAALSLEFSSRKRQHLTGCSGSSGRVLPGSNPKTSSSCPTQATAPRSLTKTMMREV